MPWRVACSLLYLSLVVTVRVERAHLTELFTVSCGSKRGACRGESRAVAVARFKNEGHRDDKPDLHDQPGMWAAGVLLFVRARSDRHEQVSLEAAATWCADNQRKNASSRTSCRSDCSTAWDGWECEFQHCFNVTSLRSGHAPAAPSDHCDPAAAHPWSHASHLLRQQGRASREPAVRLCGSVWNGGFRWRPPAGSWQACQLCVRCVSWSSRLYCIRKRNVRRGGEDSESSWGKRQVSRARVVGGSQTYRDRPLGTIGLVASGTKYGKRARRIPPDLGIPISA